MCTIDVKRNTDGQNGKEINAFVSYNRLVPASGFYCLYEDCFQI